MGVVLSSRRKKEMGRIRLLGSIIRELVSTQAFSGPVEYHNVPANSDSGEVVRYSCPRTFEILAQLVTLAPCRGANWGVWGEDVFRLGTEGALEMALRPIGRNGIAYTRGSIEHPKFFVFK